MEKSCSNHTEGVSALPYDFQRCKCRKPQVGLVPLIDDPFMTSDMVGDIRYVGCQRERGVVAKNAQTNALMDPVTRI